MNHLKAGLRKRIKRKLSALSPHSRSRKSRKITSQLFRFKRYQKARNILCYAALPGEVETRRFIQAAIKAGKRIYLPRLTNSGRMTTCRIRNWRKDLVEGWYGIPEPHPKRCPAAKRVRFHLALLPGIAFDYGGGRLGRGKGYFDRFLAKHQKTYKLGIAFSEQMVKKVPLLRHDVKMDAVMTDRCLIVCQESL